MAAEEENLRETFNEIESELAVLNKTPVSFVVVGKPGSGKSTLAKRLAAVWKCQLVDGTSTIEQIIKEGTSELAKEVRQVLYTGKEISEELVARVIKDKLVSSEIQHYGYVLDCLPSFDESWKNVPQQIEFLKTLPQPPTVIINLKIPDVDLLKRRVGQRVDPMNNEVFIKPVYDPDGPLANAQQKKKDDDDDEDEDKEESKEEMEDDMDDEEGNADRDEFQDDLGEVDSLHLLAPNIADRLVIRARDKMANVKEEIKYYKENVLSHIEDYIIQHNHQYVIELDASLSSKELFRSLLLRLTALGLRRAIAPKRLVEPEDDEVDNDIEHTDPNMFLAQVADTNILMPKFRWRRSKWGQFCPVELYKGNLVKGRLEYSVGLMDKMYCLSSNTAFADFIRCPRRYLLPPSPRIPCKICVLGPPTSGKTSLSKALAEHYNATVISVEELVRPVLDIMMEKAVDEAVQKARDDTVARLKAEQEVLQAHKYEDGSSPPPIVIPEDHADILTAIKEAEEKTRSKGGDPSPEVYVEALSLGIQQAEEARRNCEDDDRIYGGWVVDGFPLLREQWNTMVESGFIPDAVINIEADEEGGSRVLMKRYCDANDIPYPEEKEKAANTEGAEDGGNKVTVLPEEVEKWQKEISLYETQWSSLLSSISASSTVDQFKISTSLSVDDAVMTAVQHMEDIFTLTPTDISGQDEEDDGDDDPVLHEVVEEEEEEEDEEREAMEAKKRKPWGDSYHFCPVALFESNVLWPGQAEHVVRYKDKLYFFSSEEAKNKFLASPTKFVGEHKPLKPPVPRIFLLGPTASGKTEAGRILAKRLGVFHISFREYLQDQILPKMKWPPLLDPDEREGVEEKDKEDSDDEIEAMTGNDLDEDVMEALDERETELRAHLLNSEPLSEEALEDYATEFWKEEPYKSTGFIMEGLPHHGDDLRYLCSKGLYPDAAVILEIDEDNMLDRVLPKRMNIWRDRRNRKLERKRLARENALKEWEESRAKRKVEIEEDYKTKKAEYDATKKQQQEEGGGEDGEDEDDDEEDPFIDEFNEQLAEIEAEEPPEEEEEEEETEEEVEDRMRTSIHEKYEEQTESLSGIQDVLTEFQIPCHTISASRKVSVVICLMQKAMKQYFSNRSGILTKCTPIDPFSAKKLLDHSYKQISKFGYWCPVKLKEEPHSILPPPSIKATFPVIYRQRVYFMSSVSHRLEFIADPESYLAQEVPHLPVPMCLAIVGPPKSGKTTVAERFVANYGCVRLSIGEAIRQVLDLFPDSDLTEQMLSHLRVGQTLPDELCVLALERALLDVTSSTRGYVLDGWPLTKAQVDLLNKYRIIPVRIVEIKITNEEMLKRAELIRQSDTERPFPVHDSPSILLTRSGHYHKNVDAIRDWYSQEHDNWSVIDGERNCWHVWRQAHTVALKTAVQIQQYLVRVTEGSAASINCLCVTQKEFEARLGSFGDYCPVSFVERGELCDCSGQLSLEYAVEYKSHYYRTAGESELKLFLSDPGSYVNPEVKLPPDLPCRLTEMEIKQMFPRQFEIRGFCPVTYCDGKKKYKSLVPGDSQWSVEYKGKLYCCASNEKLDKFMRRPFDYEVTKLPVKLPPIKQSLPVISLPMLGYMEQSVATPIINSLTAVGCLKPKFPFLTATQSALVFVALHLKAYNPRSSPYTREKYILKLERFKEHCKLIALLGKDMKNGYQEPKERPLEFEGRMVKFLDLIRT
ncbi:PREDICTED: adenylate kinase 9-like [Amphimedon queenslandica]|uniref:Adenylate kinase 9 n=1 Tax=Amphimedon queenslandica TaxID=400682 RepID=A0A1X7VCP3_AMPQE|nr:PREDICTED: adenylate kinase 9-like [Amphimedon queenslandica]|eukprot:XP_019849767.1 PREDICTED: adenylate kinase 9-like [Amphimedon queenslandica]